MSQCYLPLKCWITHDDDTELRTLHPLGSFRLGMQGCSSLCRGLVEQVQSEGTKSLAPHNPSVVTHTCNPRPWEVETLGSGASNSTSSVYGVGGQPELQEDLVYRYSGVNEVAQQVRALEAPAAV